MIGQLRGIILQKQPPLLLLDVQGVGYEIFVPMNSFYELPELEHTVRLFTHLIVREDAQVLYGFTAERERVLFRLLIKVNGVGPKLALTILSGMDADTFVRFVQNNEATSLTAIPGIGAKTAQRLVIETKDALKNWHTLSAPLPVHTSNQAVEDAVNALISLGYKPSDAHKAIHQVAQSHFGCEQMIKLALKEMVGV